MAKPSGAICGAKEFIGGSDRVAYVKGNFNKRVTQMKKLLTIAAAGALVLSASLSVATPSFADPAGDAVGAGLLGGFLGFTAGAAVAGSAHPYHDYGYDSDYAWQHHVHSCFRVYGDYYDPDSDTFTGDDGYDHRCRLR